MALFLPGYTGVIWNAIRATFVYTNANLNSSNPQQEKALARAIASTLKNGVMAIDAGIFLTGVQSMFSTLAQLIPLPLSLDPTTIAFMQNRINCLQAAVLAGPVLLVQPLPVVTQLTNNQPAIPDPMYLEWLGNFSYETTPAGLTLDNFNETAQTAANAWGTIATALQTQGVQFSGVLLNYVNLMRNCSQVVADLVDNAVLSDQLGLDWLWNRLIVMPSVVMMSAAIMNDPTNATFQSTAVARYVTLQVLNQMNALIMSLRQTVSAQLRLGTVRQGDTLMSFANRELSDYTVWRDIAQINGLQPPYISTIKGPTVAVPGQQLFLPPPNTIAPQTPETGPVASYVNNYLGVDIYLGPLNTPMLPWTGDYQIIAGYSNLSISLGRRLQTTLGNLMYHADFGSRIPPEIGSVASDQVGDLLVEYTTSALLTDPRVNEVVSCTAVFLGKYSVEINAVVLPNGLGQEEVTVNEVIGPP